MRLLALVLVVALSSGVAHAQTDGLTIDLAPLGERPPELSEQRPYELVLTEGVTATLAAFLNARSCTRASVRSLAFEDVSGSDVSTRRLSEDGGRVFKERLFVDMCGAQYMPNYYFIHAPDRPLRMTEGVPGQTRASLQLQADVQPLVLRVARTLAQCPEPNNLGLVHTTVDEARAEDDGAWEETWIVSACRARVDIPVRFQPSERGGIDFAINGENARVTR
ncbi:MAG: hypothetical protein WDM79_04385 [Terricaulis sp.]